jgi:hypothetical protein
MVNLSVMISLSSFKVGVSGSGNGNNVRSLAGQGWTTFIYSGGLLVRCQDALRISSASLLVLVILLPAHDQSDVRQIAPGDGFISES